MINLINKERERIGETLSGTIENDVNNLLIPSPKETFKLTNEELTLDDVFNPNKAYMMGSVGFILRWKGRPEEAIENFQKALRLNPFHRNYYLVGLGNAYIDMGRYEEAIDEYKRAADYDPNDLFAHIGLASAYAFLGRDMEAIAEAMVIVRIYPKFSIQYFAKSMPFKSQGDREFWIDALQKAGLPS
jgi:adenylate cyclase